MSYRIRERCQCGAEFEAEWTKEGAEPLESRHFAEWRVGHACTAPARAEIATSKAAAMTKAELVAAFAHNDIAR